MLTRLWGLWRTGAYRSGASGPISQRKLVPRMVLCTDLINTASLDTNLLCPCDLPCDLDAEDSESKVHTVQSCRVEAPAPFPLRSITLPTGSPFPLVFDPRHDSALAAEG